MTEQINPGSINITPANASAASALIGDPSKFGRVAEDGTVYVRTSNGETAVGSYPGKTPEEAGGIGQDSRGVLYLLPLSWLYIHHDTTFHIS